MIEAWRQAGNLSDGAAERASRAFEEVARAEGAVHGQPADEVHFHEVGAIDSIVDTVGASYLLDLLGIERLYSLPVVTGYGTVDCAHGTLPVPAPATARILEGIPVTTGPYEGEMTTPTGAALLKCNVTDWGAGCTMVPLATGMGLGTRRIEGTTNCLRLIVGEPVDLEARSTDEQPQDRFSVESCVLLQSNIDHISPEMAASCCEDLMAAGALDGWQQPITMKKGRLGILLNVLARPAEADATSRLISKLTGSLGVRRMLVERTVAPREQVELQTQHGPVRYKVAEVAPAEERPHWARPEHDDVARIARETGMSYQETFAELMRAWRS